MAWRLAKHPRVSEPPSSGMPAASADTETQGADTDARRPNYYLEHPAVASLTTESADALRRQLDIKVHGAGCPNPVGSFLQASFPKYLLDALDSAGYVEPTAIQRQSWPIAMSGHDLVGLAETGSGKTLAYLLPALVHVNAQPLQTEGDGPIALALAPTRELAMQIHEECVRFGHPCGVRTACIMGGVPRGPQIQALRKAPEMVVATPGRLSDLLAAKRTDLSHCTLAILDEADRMLDLGFEPQIRALLRQTRAERQTLLFSATWPAEVQALATGVLLPGSLVVEVGGALARSGRANARISQRVQVVEEAGKMPALVGLLEELMDTDTDSRLMIFTSSRRRADDLTRALRLDGWPALALHGDKSQEERDWVLHEFKEGRQPLLVATDVAQRGLDIKDVRCVINFDCPSSGEAYVHRIGRSGRAGADGAAVTLLTAEDARMAVELVRVLKGSGQPVGEDVEALARGAQGRAPR